VIRREAFAAHQVNATPRTVTLWRDFSQSGHWMGPERAPVTVVVFSDFQCPYCALLMHRLGVLRAKYPQDVAVVYRHFPLAVHQYSMAAARASECAASQGRFEAFHNALFASQEAIGRVPWTHFALTAGVRDTTAFSRCTVSDSALLVVARDSAAAKRLGVEGTPVLLINQTRLEGAQPLDTLEVYVARILHSAM
jgi:protein-disulfide isomerase